MFLQTLTYTSLAQLDLTGRDLRDILASARRRNAAADVTGLLIFNGVRFLQIVEGPAAALERLLSKLRTDPRHSAVEVREQRSIPERAFPDWSMVLVQVSSDGFRVRDEVASALPEAMRPDIRERVLAMTTAMEPVTLPQ